MTSSSTPSPDDGDGRDDDASPPCVMTFNANDPSGSAGLAADITAIASVGAHALPVLTGTYVRDTAEVMAHYAMDEESVDEQARAVLEDVPVRVFKVGFAGTPENLSTIAEITSDYADAPVVAWMPHLSWWDEDRIDAYHDAFRELLMPQVTVLVGNHSTLWRWLLPDWSDDRPPSPRDIAAAAAEAGVPYTLVTGISQGESTIENALATPQQVLHSQRIERIEASFSGAGDTLSATLAALIASGSDLAGAVEEALGYLDRCLDAGFQPGMGLAIPDRLFWAQPEDTDSDDEAPAGADDDSTALGAFNLPAHDTKH
ncbi:MAG: hypothetical protein RL087_1647 [Pseudomonadota bacterium]|jgi:hydroxymethylpyrimidine/phosphomethylpyrimidine kinase